MRLHESEEHSTSLPHPRRLPAAAIFVDLSKAFDNVTWQTVFGMTPDRKCGCSREAIRATLTDLNVPEPVLSTPAEYIHTNGSLLREPHVPERISR